MLPALLVPGSRASLLAPVRENGCDFSLASLIVVIIGHVGLVAEGGELRGSFEEVLVGVDGVCHWEAYCPLGFWEYSLDSLHIGEVVVVHVVDVAVN